MDDVATVNWRLDDHETGPPAIKKIYSDVEHQPSIMIGWAKLAFINPVGTGNTRVNPLGIDDLAV